MRKSVAYLFYTLALWIIMVWTIIVFCPPFDGALALSDGMFGHEPGGKTIGGPSQSILPAGSEKELLTFLRSGPDPFVFVCTTGFNKGPGVISLTYQTRIGGTKSSKFLSGESRVVCGEVTAIFVECHSGQDSQCEFLWRVDVLR